jgi:ribosomal protein S8
MQNSILSIFLSKLNIAKQGHFVSVKVENTGMTLKLLEMFEDIGVIRGYHVVSGENKIKVVLRYVKGSFNIFFKMVQISRPGRRVYVDVMHLVKLKERESGNNIYILSTCYGIMFDSECILKKVGGEVIIKIIM